jgi:hypothetical protein
MQFSHPTEDRLVDGAVEYDSVFVASGFECRICGLTLTSAAEIHAAGMKQEYTRRETEHYPDDDYSYDRSAGPAS